MSWSQLLFAHRRAQAERVIRRLTAGLTLGTYAREPWVAVAAVLMSAVVPCRIPAVPGQKSRSRIEAAYRRGALLEIAQAFLGPMALGYASHFGFAVVCGSTGASIENACMKREFYASQQLFWS